MGAEYAFRNTLVISSYVFLFALLSLFLSLSPPDSFSLFISFLSLMLTLYLPCKFPSKSCFTPSTVNISAQVCTFKKFLLILFLKDRFNVTVSLSGFPAPTLKLIPPLLPLSHPFFLPLTAFLSLRLHFSFSLMRF